MGFPVHGRNGARGLTIAGLAARRWLTKKRCPQTNVPAKGSPAPSPCQPGGRHRAFPAVEDHMRTRMAGSSSDPAPILRCGGWEQRGPNQPMATMQHHGWLTKKTNARWPRSGKKATRPGTANREKAVPSLTSWGTLAECRPARVGWLPRKRNLEDWSSKRPGYAACTGSTFLRGLVIR